MKHDFKIEKPLYERMVNGEITFHITDKDDLIQMGDTAFFYEWDYSTQENGLAKGHTGSKILEYRVGFVNYHGKTVFSLLPIKTKSKS